MANRISPTTFYQYLACPLQLWFELQPNYKSKKGSSSAIREELVKRGRAYEKTVAESFGIDAVSPTSDDMDEAFQETLEFLRDGKTVYQGVLLDSVWSGRPDFLIPKRGKSRLGSHHYTVMDVKLANDISDVHRFQLTFYALLLEKIQGVRPKYAYLMSGDGKKIRFEVNEFVDRFALTLKEIEKIFSGEKPVPFLSGSCKDSAWFHECVREAELCNDLSLIYKIWRSEYDRLRLAGIKTVKDLADANIEHLKKKVSGVTLSRLEQLKRQAVSFVENTHVVKEIPVLPKSKVEVYYDVESDVLQTPLLHYLHGALVVTHTKKGVTAKYKAFLVRNIKQEGPVWKRFYRFVQDLPEGTAIYHYGRYEHQVVSELTSRYGISQKALTKFGEMIDLGKTAQRSVIFPTQFYSLKDLAKYLGFHWRHAEASGINSVKWYQDWRAKKSAPSGKKMLKDILEYNEDDVIATRVLKDFFASLETTALSSSL